MRQAALVAREQKSVSSAVTSWALPEYSMSDETAPSMTGSMNARNSENTGASAHTLAKQRAAKKTHATA